MFKRPGRPAAPSTVEAIGRLSGSWPLAWLETYFEAEQGKLLRSKNRKMRACADSVNLSLAKRSDFPRGCRFGFSVKIFLNRDKK
jgi:hypothetical protein